MNNRFGEIPEEIKPEGESDPAMIRRKIGEIDTGDSNNPIDMMHTEIKKPEEILKFKPKNSSKDDATWVLMAGLVGIDHQINHDFQDWMKQFDSYNGLFGDIETEFEQSNPKPQDIDAHKEWFKRYTAYILAHLTSQDLSTLGKFGRWAEEAEITDKELLLRIAKEFLED